MAFWEGFKEIVTDKNTGRAAAVIVMAMVGLILFAVLIGIAVRL